MRSLDRLGWAYPEGLRWGRELACYSPVHENVNLCKMLSLIYGAAQRCLPLWLAAQYPSALLAAFVEVSCASYTKYS
jgi:hypothetical protein